MPKIMEYNILVVVLIATRGMGTVLRVDSSSTLRPCAGSFFSSKTIRFPTIEEIFDGSQVKHAYNILTHK